MFDRLLENVKNALSKTRLCESDFGTSDRTRFTVHMDVTQSQGIALQAMFEYWNHLASAGGSRKVAFYVDGDGNFKPNCDIVFENKSSLQTDEASKLAIVEDVGGNRVYDFDPIGWKLLDTEEELQEKSKGKE